MQEFLSEKRNLMIVLVVLVVAAVILLFMSRRGAEGFNGEAEAVPKVVEAPKAVAPVVPVAANTPAAPQVNVRVGALIDGAGREDGPVGVVTGVFDRSIPDNYYFLQDGADGAMGVQNNLCSPSCCSSQWPTPWKQKSDPYVCDGLKKGLYVPSRMFCNNTFNDSGCMCLTKDQARFLYLRGSNGSEFF